MSDLTKVVIALGGNALQSKDSDATAESQLETVKKTCKHIAEIVRQKYEIAIVHGNGPQVGRILLTSETAAEITPVMPFDVCGAMSQGYIGYHIQQSLKKANAEIGRADIPIVTLVTQVLVDKDDPGFSNPTKPIGKYYTKEEADELVKTKGYTMKEDAGRGWRRVVASPKPIEILEIDTVRRLWDSTIVIVCGGGGIPVIRTDHNEVQGVPAVIDKDFAAEKLAEETDANILLILTEVEKVCLNFGKPDQKELHNVSIAEAEEYIAQGHFAPGSMLPKVEACLTFVKKYPDRKAIITSLDKAVEALNGETGTVFLGQ